ncbi:tetratricopeptide repeat protein [Flaviramulus aquimarinus]|uniref:Tetratricopeptide repeat protein n=1 Tax=Flaviramulus aquimarinus TaxID=1170456 RepID=A0ABP9F3X8_9FLAO
MFVPVIGCVIYLITQVYNKRDAEKITNEITHIINPTKKVRDLEKRLEFSESYQNRVNLADAYLEIKDYANAIMHYLEALEDQSQNNFYATKQLIEAFFSIEDNDSVILYVENIKNHPEYKKSRTQFLCGLALERVGKIEDAERNLRQIDIRYSFYDERLILAKFLLNIKKDEDAKAILNDIYTESSHMTKPNKRLYRATILEVEKLLKELN